MRETGLFDLLQNHIINKLYDYVLGIEVDLDSVIETNFYSGGGSKLFGLLIDDLEHGILENL